MHIPTMRLSFTDNRISPRDIKKIRGYIAKKFPQYIELHHHVKKDKLLYKYPRIQYKVIKGIPMVLGINKGVNILQNIYDKINEIYIEEGSQVVFEKQIVLKTEEFGIAYQLLSYKFLSPWLALNEENYKKYVGSNRLTRSELLEKIVIGNIISMAKSLEYVIMEEIRAKVKVRSARVSLKGVPMIGFLGTFSVNFNLPDYIGLGKSVSRGFGTVKKINNNQ